MEKQKRIHQQKRKLVTQDFFLVFFSESMGKKYGGSDSVTFARTWDEGRTHLGILEFTSRRAMIKAIDSLHGHRVNGYKVYAKEM